MERGKDVFSGKCQSLRNNTTCIRDSGRAWHLQTGNKSPDSFFSAVKRRFSTCLGKQIIQRKFSEKGCSERIRKADSVPQTKKWTIWLHFLHHYNHFIPPKKDRPSDLPLMPTFPKSKNAPPHDQSLQPEASGQTH